MCMRVKLYSSWMSYLVPILIMQHMKIVDQCSAVSAVEEWLNIEDDLEIKYVNYVMNFNP